MNTATMPESTAPTPDALDSQPAPRKPDRIEDCILALTGAQGPGKSICPSEVARAVHPGPQAEGWQAMMTPVRNAAIRLAKAGRIEILRKGRPVAMDAVRGVIRLRAVAAADDTPSDPVVPPHPEPTSQDAS